MLEFLSSENYVEYNIILANILGLNGAVYCSEILNIQNKAKQKNKLVDNDYVKLNRDYIKKRTTLSIEEQLTVDANLIKINLLKKHQDDPDIVKLDLKLLISLMSSDDVELVDNIRDKLKLKTTKEIKGSKRQRNIAELKESISYSNYELVTAMRDWIDSIYSKPNGYLSKPVLKIFEDTLNDYTMLKDGSGMRDLDLALRLIKIATTQGYKDCQWAINVYERDQAILAKKEAIQKTQVVRTTEQVKATIDKLSDEVF